MQINNSIQGELPADLKEKIENILAKDRVVLFMKGDRFQPRCGFSDAVVKVLNFHNCEFATYDVLSEPDLRSGMKVFSEWATFPQLYVDKEFVGGCDIIMEMQQNGEMAGVLN